jgi:hypothetical protein
VIPPCLVVPKNVGQLILEQKLCKFPSAPIGQNTKFSYHVLHSKRMALGSNHFSLLICSDKWTRVDGSFLVSCFFVFWFCLFNFKFCMKKVNFISETFYWKLDAPAYHNKRKINSISPFDKRYRISQFYDLVNLLQPMLYQPKSWKLDRVKRSKPPGRVSKDHLILPLPKRTSNLSEQLVNVVSNNGSNDVSLRC